jgi:hypothetical protein
LHGVRAWALNNLLDWDGDLDGVRHAHVVVLRDGHIARDNTLDHLADGIRPGAVDNLLNNRRDRNRADHRVRLGNRALNRHGGVDGHLDGVDDGIVDEALDWDGDRVRLRDVIRSGDGLRDRDGDGVLLENLDGGRHRDAVGHIERDVTRLDHFDGDRDGAGDGDTNVALVGDQAILDGDGHVAMSSVHVRDVGMGRDRGVAVSRRSKAVGGDSGMAMRGNVDRGVQARDVGVHACKVGVRGGVSKVLRGSKLLCGSKVLAQHTWLNSWLATHG